MAFLLWKEQYSVNVEVFDNEHKELFELVNQLVNAIKAGTAEQELQKIADGLIEYTKIHFSHEEELMLKFKYPKYAAHKKAHDQLTGQVELVKNRILDKNLDPDKLLRFLMKWLLVHIMESDKQYADFFAARGMAVQN